ncbi:hypothetical protein [Paenibacillus alba]|uniref:Helix-turn-helix domain-containing protein n=1 Tax=Paenibacillus alba TaxID=1197127 RepID=A0ABU6GAE2_9BACL|nr:hypothetical protein [Paenibacillus alba]MEC0231173.1 hypothetical protein [Paenibacillus alba]
MATGVSIDDNTKEQIKGLLATGMAKNAVAKQIGVSWATVDKVSKEEPDNLESLREHKRSEMIERLWENMSDALELGHDIVKKAKRGEADVPLSHISTYYGTLYDKHALMTGGKTGQVGLTGGLNNTTQDLNGLTPDERRARIDELNRRRGNGANSAS